MFAELGNLFLHSALIISLLIAASPLYAFVLEKHKLLFYIRISWYLVFILSLISFFCLIICYIISDFSVLNVVNNSHTSKPLIYKISGAWGNHEGSMLLWICSLAFFSSLFALFNHTPIPIIKNTLVIQSLLITFFISFTIFTSNPFLRVFPTPRNGYGLNPILQDIGLAMHPPMLYLGYVGFSLIYSGAIAALLEGAVRKSFSTLFRPWVILSWTFLTLGIALGSWWAYRELGWGGFWFWDPVENSSLMPWLTATALIHSLIVLEKFENLKNWNLLLAITTFTLSMIGTFLVRSNIITSVHSFAQDPKRGICILVFLGFATTTALILYALQAKRIHSSYQDYNLLSRETFVLINNLFLLIAAFIVILGTLYPAILEIFTGQKVSVGPPYFNSLIAPLAITLLFFITIGSQLNWKRSKYSSLIKQNKFPILLSLVLTIALSLHLEITSILACLAIFLALWLMIGISLYFISRLKTFSLNLLSMYLAHFGFALLVLSISLSSALELEIEKPLRLKESLALKSFQLKLENLELTQEKNYLSRLATFEVVQHSQLITRLFPETRFFTVELQQTTESAIYHSLFYDLYLATGELDNNGFLMVRAYYKPMMSWIWFSCFLIFLGGISSLIRKVFLDSHD